MIAWPLTVAMALAGATLVMRYTDPWNRRHMWLRLLGCCLLAAAPWALGFLL